MIKAIETQYKGYRFRSRLEARWAVFFDALGLKWGYEPEGYDLGKAGYYLPDFYLPQIGCFWEVKPENGASNEDEQRLWAFALSGENLVVAFGSPGSYQAKPFPYAYIPKEDDYALWTNFEGVGEGMLSHCPICDRVDFTYNGWAGYIAGCYCYKGYKSYKFDGTSTTKMLSAITAARSARFEHGETPHIEKVPNNFIHPINRMMNDDSTA